MMKPHKWAKEIKAWADGAEIEFRHFEAGSWGSWESLYEDPAWLDHDNIEYRIKPTPKEPQYLYVFRTSNNGQTEYKLWHNEDTGGAYIGKIKLETDDE